MKIASFITIAILVSIFSSSSAHFFPNISSIPRTLTPKTTAWEGFNKLLGCRTGQTVDGLSKLKQYFQYFGYLNNNNNYSSLNFTDDFDDALEFALRTYQVNFNLNVTGELDAPTLTHIVRPRCGNPDMVNGTSSMNSGKVRDGNYSSSSKHMHTVAHYSFFPGRPRWPKTSLTYAFDPENPLSDDVKSVFTRAFQRWSEVIPLTFTETTSYSSADMKIGFYSGDHGDGEAFDGVLGTLAHAFSPPSGRFHLDRDENWVIEGEFINTPTSVISAVDLESVAVHEIGHLLGLGHSSVEESIMYPTISSNTRKVELHGDDIEGIQSLYGSNPNYNGSLLDPSPWGGRDTSGAHILLGSFLCHELLLFIGFILIFVL